MGVKTFIHSSPTHSQEMLGKLNMLRNEGHFCDVTIRVQDKVFMAHKVVLASCSEFFRTKLVGKLQEEDKCVLDLNHVTVSGFTPLLEYAYTSTLSLNTENIIDVLAAASYMQMFTVASTCSEFMKSSILWNSANNLQQEKPQESAPENSTNCTFTPQDGSVSPVSSECSVIERTIPICRESRRKRKSYIVMSPESPLKCSTQNTSPQIQNASTSFTETQSHPVDSSLAFPWTFPFGIDRRFQSEKPKQAESPRSLEQPGPSDVTRRLDDYLNCEGTKATSPLAAEEDVHVKVERLSDEEVHEEVSQPVSASQSSLSDQQTVPGSEQVHEDLLISPQSSSIGSVDEGVSEGLPSLQGTSSAGGHADDDERLESVQYPYHLYITPSTRPSTNGPDRPFQCPTCGVRFTRIQNLKQHMLIHSGIKPFQCDRCGKKFTRAYSLKMHRLKHEGKRCFRCQICSATFTSFGEYKHHMRVSRHIIRKPRIYECKTCGAMFTNSGNLIVHLRSLNHEASELANYFQSSDFLVPDYLNQVQEEALGQYELGDHHFEGNPSIQMPVISQVSSTQNCESTFPLASLGGLGDKEEEEEEEEEDEEEQLEDPKRNEETEEDLQKKESSLQLESA
ncbi:zinc finger and BTB domain-containing protein 44 isoform X1 [Polyodon spathula]|uniref:zinc finger and BTB domain-containing protein 44 isoform X1 n=1 Tax=Polyodon spathula TaxID=7913 RepID=UPI001B7EC3F7|nr:zinc finger and BTB domain-containing protein 44 isoform X1 [Polyodon spathula]